MREQSYKDRHYDESKLESFVEKRRDCFDFDIKIQYDEENFFFAHREVLLLTDGYFHTVLSSGKKESQCDLVKVEFPTILTTKMFEQFLNYFYNGTICINEKNVKSIAQAANFLNEPRILAHCSEFLISIVNTSNAIELENFARKEGLLELITYIKGFICTNFYEVTKSDSFKYVSFETLCDVMSSNITVNNEKTVLKAIFEWFLVNKRERIKKVSELIRHLNFGWLTSSDLSSLCEQTEDTTEFMKVLIEHKPTKLSSDLDRFSSEFKRRYWGRYFVVDDYGIYCHWFGYGSMEKVCDADFSGAIKCVGYEGKMYILHGVDDFANITSFYCYDPTTNTLKKLESLLKPVEIPTLCAFKGSIYVFNTIEEMYQVFSTDSNTWKLIKLEKYDCELPQFCRWREVLCSSYNNGFVASSEFYKDSDRTTFLNFFVWNLSAKEPSFLWYGRTELCSHEYSTAEELSACKHHCYYWSHQVVIGDFLIAFKHLSFRWYNFVKEKSGPSSFRLLDDENDDRYELLNVSQYGDRLIIGLIDKTADFESRTEEDDVPSPTSVYLVSKCSDVLKNIQEGNACFTVESISEKFEFELDESCDLSDAHMLLL